ncbi:MAG: hypothetical protein ACLFP8_06185 [Alphaproteobacteria bacterium]
MPVRSSMQIAYIDPSIMVHEIEPASGITSTPLNDLNVSRNNNNTQKIKTNRLSYFQKYREKAIKKAAARQHKTLKKRLQQQHLNHSAATFPPVLSLQNDNSANKKIYTDYPTHEK